MTVIKKLTSQLMEQFITEARKEENIDKVRKDVLDPMINYTMGRIYPYMIATAALFVLTFLVAIIILIILLKK